MSGDNANRKAADQSLTPERQALHDRMVSAIDRRVRDELAAANAHADKLEASELYRGNGEPEALEGIRDYAPPGSGGRERSPFDPLAGAVIHGVRIPDPTTADIESRAQRLRALEAALDDARNQARIAWERHAEKDRAYESMIKERDQAHAAVNEQITTIQRLQTQAGELHEKIEMLGKMATPSDAVNARLLSAERIANQRGETIESLERGLDEQAATIAKLEAKIALYRTATRADMGLAPVDEDPHCKEREEIAKLRSQVTAMSKERDEALVEVNHITMHTDKIISTLVTYKIRNLRLERDCNEDRLAAERIPELRNEIRRLEREIADFDRVRAEGNKQARKLVDDNGSLRYAKRGLEERNADVIRQLDERTAERDRLFALTGPAQFWRDLWREVKLDAPLSSPMIAACCDLSTAIDTYANADALALSGGDHQPECESLATTGAKCNCSAAGISSSDDDIPF